MNFIAEIEVMPNKELLDPQGKAVKLGLHNLGLKEVKDVRVGKHIVLNIDADNEEEANNKVDQACQKLLTNMIVETYTFKVKAAEEEEKP